MEIIFMALILCVLIVFGILIFLLIKKLNPENSQTLLQKEFEQIRNEIMNSAKESRQELQQNLNESRQEMQKTILDFTGHIDQNFEKMRSSVERKLSEIQQDNFLKFEQIQKTMVTFTGHIDQNFERVRQSVEKKLGEIQKDNAEKIEQMRQTVDEKLHKTLETRLGESFKLVSQRLEDVHRGLGQMQELATGVGDLKKVLSNVKTKGILGEYQLASILEQMLTPNQYAANVRVNPNSNDAVEFAVKIPSKEDSSKIIWLAVDAKFPTVTYEFLMKAYEKGDIDEIKNNQKELAATIKKFAGEIKSKYICPPDTLDFAIMYLPFEGLYAEVLRIPGLLEDVQRSHKVIITGPSTTSALLNSLQMGFRTLAIEKRTSEIWTLLSAVKSEFGKFGDVLAKAKSKIDSASKEMDNIGQRTRAIDRKLRDVQELPQADDPSLLKF
ncbi:MAG: DNA recombination protein RmuC [Elusimicrobiota bacterium]|jgi:DNA recombination protein RmuC|nr:DNA recombination protein RmuC [Elusimicrobiota bacterium]